MKTLAELQAGDMVKLEWRHYSFGKEKAESQWRVVTKVTDKLIHCGLEDKYRRDTGASVSRRRVRVIRVPTPEELTELADQQAAAREAKMKREAFMATEAYRLASYINNIGNSIETDRLSTMPLDRLRQIVAWLDEHEKGQP